MGFRINLLLQKLFDQNLSGKQNRITAIKMCSGHAKEICDLFNEKKMPFISNTENLTIFSHLGA